MEPLPIAQALQVAAADPRLGSADVEILALVLPRLQLPEMARQMPAGELGNRSGLTRSTATRCLARLCDAGWLVRGRLVDRVPTFSPGLELQLLARMVRDLPPAAHVIHAYLLALSDGGSIVVNRARLGSELGLSRVTTSAAVGALVEACLLEPAGDGYRVHGWDRHDGPNGPNRSIRCKRRTRSNDSPGLE